MNQQYTAAMQKERGAQGAWGRRGGGPQAPDDDNDDDGADGGDGDDDHDDPPDRLMDNESVTPGRQRRKIKRPANRNTRKTSRSTSRTNNTSSAQDHNMGAPCRGDLSRLQAQLVWPIHDDSSNVYLGSRLRTAIQDAGPKLCTAGRLH